MNILDVLENIDVDEKMIYMDSTANEYFRYTYYSREGTAIISKLDSNEKLTDDEWKYLISRLFMVTYKAYQEEDNLSFIDKINYVINKIGIKVFKKGKIHNECVKLLAFLESIRLEIEINDDLSDGLEKVENSRKEEDLNTLLKQHREALIFRDNQDAFLDSCRNDAKGVITDDEDSYIDSMDRSYIREKELVKEYK